MVPAPTGAITSGRQARSEVAAVVPAGPGPWELLVREYVSRDSGAGGGALASAGAAGGDALPAARERAAVELQRANDRLTAAQERQHSGGPDGRAGTTAARDELLARLDLLDAQETMQELDLTLALRAAVENRQALQVARGLLAVQAELIGPPGSLGWTQLMLSLRGSERQVLGLDQALAGFADDIGAAKAAYEATAAWERRYEVADRLAHLERLLALAHAREQVTAGDVAELQRLMAEARKEYHEVVTRIREGRGAAVRQVALARQALEHARLAADGRAGGRTISRWPPSSTAAP